MSEEERNCSVMGMEQDESLRRTMECLRGRLVAERQHSRTAQENADELSYKLKELEKKVNEETRMMNKAQKKLRLLQRKLESMNLSVKSEDIEHQPSSSISENSLPSSESESSTASTLTSSTSKQPQEERPGSQISDGVLSVNAEHNSRATETSIETCHEKVGPDIEAFEPDDHSPLSRKVSEKEEDGVNNSLALVPVKNADAKESESRELKIISRSVSEVLEALRLAREGIQRSMREKQQQKHVLFLLWKRHGGRNSYRAADLAVNLSHPTPMINTY